jgi:signal transduction histidine kinase
VWCIVSATPLFKPGGVFDGSFAMLTDITDRKAIEQDLKNRYGELNNAHEEMSVTLEELQSTEEALVARNRELEEQKIALAESGDSLRMANRKLNLLSSVTRHDVLNQLMILNGFVELSQRSATDGRIRNLIEKENLVIERIHRLISFTKEYEEIGIHVPVWQDVRSTAEHAIAGLDYPGISIDESVDGLEIYADPLLQKVFYNLLDNAIRHGEKVSSVEISCERSGDELVVSVSDDGTGIDSAMKAYIFDKGFGKNTGYGLFLSREILQITGLSIRETGTAGSGARFELVVPKGVYRVRS